MRILLFIAIFLFSPLKRGGYKKPVIARFFFLRLDGSNFYFLGYKLTIFTSGRTLRKLRLSKTDKSYVGIYTINIFHNILIQ